MMDVDGEPEPLPALLSAKKKQLLSAAMKRTSDWIFSQEIPSDITVHVGGASFSLHKFPLVSKCGYIRKLVSEAGDPELSLVEVPDLPGGAEAFELAAKFCYGINFEINTDNVAAIRCAAEQLEMTEDYAAGNLVSRTEDYLTGAALVSLPGSISVLRRAQGLLPLAERVNLVGRCVEAVACMVCEEAAQTEADKGSEGAGGAGARGAEVVEWWAEELALLRVDVFKRVAAAMKARGFKEDALGPLLMLYAQKALRGGAWEGTAADGGEEGAREAGGAGDGGGAAPPGAPRHVRQLPRRPPPRRHLPRDHRRLPPRPRATHRPPARPRRPRRPPHPLLLPHHLLLRRYRLRPRHRPAHPRQLPRDLLRGRTRRRRGGRQRALRRRRVGVPALRGGRGGGSAGGHGAGGGADGGLPDRDRVGPQPERVEVRQLRRAHPGAGEDHRGWHVQSLGHLPEGSPLTERDGEEEGLRRHGLSQALPGGLRPRRPEQPPPRPGCRPGPLLRAAAPPGPRHRLHPGQFHPCRGRLPCPLPPGHPHPHRRPSPRPPPPGRIPRSPCLRRAVPPAQGERRPQAGAGQDAHAGEGARQGRHPPRQRRLPPPRGRHGGFVRQAPPPQEVHYEQCLQEARQAQPLPALRRPEAAAREGEDKGPQRPQAFHLLKHHTHACSSSSFCLWGAAPEAVVVLVSCNCCFNGISS